MTALRWPKPGTVFPPDRLDEVRALLREWPGRGVWEWNDGQDRGREEGYPVRVVLDGETWTYLHRAYGDPTDAPEAPSVEPVEAWAFRWRADADAEWTSKVRPHRDDVALYREELLADGCECGPIVRVLLPLPMPDEPVTVVAEVSDDR